MTSDRDPQDGQPTGPVSPQPDEEFLLGRVRRGDRDAFEELVRRKSDQAYRLARRVVGDDEDARDVVQGALLRVWGERARFRPGSAFDPWFHRIVVNLAIDTLRRETVQRRSRTRAALEVGTRAGRDRISRPQIPREMRHDEVVRIFDELARDLPPRQRAIFALREIEGMTTQEVAGLLGVRPSTVRNHLFQARSVLQRSLSERYPEYLPRGRRGEGT
jgi:RNA polymerase sigma-70 factor, ECF subfamily